eukprot:1156903-Pelagomonas_calceolata.AAC.8
MQSAHTYTRPGACIPGHYFGYQIRGFLKAARVDPRKLKVSPGQSRYPLHDILGMRSGQLVSNPKYRLCFQGVTPSKNETDCGWRFLVLSPGLPAVERQSMFSLINMMLGLPAVDNHV